MEDFIFVSQTGCQVKDSKSRGLVRAHVTRKYWQEIKEKATPVTHTVSLTSALPRNAKSHSHARELTSSQKLTTSRFGKVEKGSITAVAKQNSRPQCLHTSLCRTIGHGAEALVYAGSFLDSDSYGFFHHYGSEFKVVLCNQIQPIHIDSPAICCTQAIQMHSPALLHAVCFQAAAHEAVARANMPLRQDMFRQMDHAHGLEKQALHHQAKALSNLRKSFDAMNRIPAALETSILCVAILLAAEAILGDGVGLKSHSRGLRQLIAANGGLETLSASTVSLIRFADVKAAIAQGRAPYYELSSILKEPTQECSTLLVSTVTGGCSIHNFGLAFASPPLLSQLCPALLQCITKARYLTLACSGQSKYRQTSEACGIDDFVNLDSSLLLLKDSHHLSRLEQCVRLAMLLFTNTALWRTPPFFNWITFPLAELKSNLLYLDQERNVEQHTGVLLWIAFLGRYVVRMGTKAERYWWSERLGQIAACAGITTFQDARYIVHVFAYVDEAYTLAWEQIWNEVVVEETHGYRTWSGDTTGPDLKTEKHPCDYRQS